jgi:hypothetical protein
MKYLRGHPVNIFTISPDALFYGKSIVHANYTNDDLA